ncbi:hypothetical protein K443DRAFT_10190 [Laccaria amethystina LaAM-08-1]|uniref:DJ-1/PfpI domain-containing protein n=1 Tax=Laccaria amethystina LaAM-08-1 TaxID=1095629 RepID=A0A0C9XLL0_9AGAR|nr:hypothetical protein K443DRAFT_10190 [Laccaria amethystina LaAM-08-1]
MTIDVAAYDQPDYSPPNLRIEVLLLPDHQNLNVIGTTGYLNDHSQDFLSKFPTVQRILTWYFIPDTLDPITATSGPKQLPTHTLSEGCTEFVKKRWADPKALFLTVCNGSLVLAQTGVLDGTTSAPTKWR